MSMQGGFPRQRTHLQQRLDKHFISLYFGVVYCGLTSTLRYACTILCTILTLLCLKCLYFTILSSCEFVSLFHLPEDAEDMCKIKGFCVNGESCQDNVCKCPAGYRLDGTFCVNINECERHPCGLLTCLDTIGSFTCECAAGQRKVRTIEGDQCEGKINSLVLGDVYEENEGYF